MQTVCFFAVQGLRGHALVRLIRSVFAMVCACLLLSALPAAAQVTLAWNANTEPDIAGYQVQYGPTSAPFTTSVNVGKVTTWTFSTPVQGTAYAFRVLAYNTSNEYSLPSSPVYGNADGSTPATLTADRAALTFGFIPSAAAPTTRTQTIQLTQGAGETVAWTVASSAAWLQVSPASGAGSGAFLVSLVPGAIPPANAAASLTVTAPGALTPVPPISVALNVIAPSAAKPPFGSFDTPVNNTTGVTGSLAVTGWALDDVDVTRIRIYRDPVPGETPGSLVYIGDGLMVDDARPDVAADFATYPDAYHAGWGYLLLTNMFPNGGNGTFRLYAYADDAAGFSTLLGTSYVTCTNATATQPFGAIDTPAPGETTTGTDYVNFGWVLSHGNARADGLGGGTVSVLIDGAIVGAPTGWSARPDLTALFPAAQYSGVNFAEAAFAFNPNAMANGVHTIAWVVTDNKGNTQGIGSRFFHTFNGTGVAPALRAGTISGVAASVSPVAAASLVASAQADPSPIQARRGFDLSAAFQSHGPGADGRVTLQAEELDRIELQTHGATQGFLRVGAAWRPLPAGSLLNPETGMFTWAPGVGFVGAYDLTFVGAGPGAPTRQDVRIVLNPKGSNRVGPQLVVDQVQPFVAGWAADLDAAVGTGIDTIHVWAYPVDASGARGTPVFVGVAAYGGARPDVAGVYGAQFLDSGFGIVVTGLPPGTYDLALFPWSTAHNGFLSATVARLVIK